MPRPLPATSGSSSIEDWRLTSLRAFDIFPMTEHVEIVARIQPPEA